MEGVDCFVEEKADWWFVGAFLFEMVRKFSIFCEIKKLQLVGFPPFIADNIDEMYHKIYHCEKSLYFYRYQMSGTAEDFIKKYQQF